MAATTVPEMRTFMISEEERVEMVRLLEQSLKETRGEIHKTHTPDYRDRVIGQETCSVVCSSSSSGWASSSE